MCSSGKRWVNSPSTSALAQTASSRIPSIDGGEDVRVARACGTAGVAGDGNRGGGGHGGVPSGSGSGAWPLGTDFGALVRELPDVVLVLDVEKLKVRDVNRGGPGAFGFTRDELLACDGFTLFPRWWD